MFYRETKARLMKMAVVVGATSLLSAPAFAEMALEDVLAIAYHNNPTIQAQRDAVRSSDEKIAEVFAGFLPSVEFQASITKSWTHYSGIGITIPAPVPVIGGDSFQLLERDETATPKIFTTTIDQPIFTGGRNLNGMRQARAAVEGNLAQLADVQQQIFLQTVSAYMDVIANQAVVSLSENNVKVLEQQRTATQDRFDVGELTRTDVAQAEARLSNVQSRLIAAESDLRGSRAQLEKLIGVPVETLKDPESLPAIPDSEETAQAIGRDQAPALVAARAYAEAAEHGVKVVAGEWLPTVFVRGQFEYRMDADLLSDTAFEKSVTGVLNWKLFQGGAVLSRKRQAQYDANRTLNQEAEAERGVSESVTNAWTGLLAARSTIRAAQAAVDANEIALEGVRQESEVGARTTLDVLDAEQELLDARVTLEKARRNEVVATYQLLAATGQLNTEYLGLPVDQVVLTKRRDGIYMDMFGGKPVR